ncbi:rhomboid family intramembrane serine protease [Gordonia sp. TBRC 11910]|uniref:Rhomboid family intramembrane serine protease n=1 Tax=Gordonia asplenii TaxID=2725283 RepID=A0A848KWF1_9ACTN|nr:rhomboid family intramembrane serine protease [Gordonia asplenii]NMO02619.1 rhomboid family intramembrane serine protease [Gordonia asplenii]
MGRASTTTVAGARPLVTYTLIAINVAIYGICAVQAKSTDIAATLPPLFDRWALSGLDLANGEYWRLLTSGFLHLSLIHIGVNMFSLYVLGRSLEPALGSSQFTMVYLTALFGGSAAVGLFASPLVLTAGASGAIYGLMGALLVLVLRARASVGPVLGIIAVNIVLSITLPGISILAHLGGLAFGVVSAAVFVFVPGLMLRDPTSRTVAGVTSATRVAWAVAGVVLVIAVVAGVYAGRLPLIESPLT